MFTFDGASQLVSSTVDGVTTRYTYDAAGRFVKEGNKTYRYGYLDKVMSVSDGKQKRTYDYHADGHAFLFRNYRASLGKWQTADPLGYPDGWNQLAYCGNMAVEAIDFLGGEIRIIKEYDGDEWIENTYLGSHEHDGRSCEIYLIETYVYHYMIAQNFNRIRRWESIDGLVDMLNGIGYGLDIAGGIAGITGVGSIPAGGVFIGGILCHTVADILNALNGYIDVPVGEPFEISKTKRKVGSFEVHKFE